MIKPKFLLVKKFLHEQPIYTRIQNKYVQDEKQIFTKIINDFFHSVKRSTCEYAFQEVAEKMGYDEILPEEREAFILLNKSSNKRDSISFLKRSKAKDG